MKYGFNIYDPDSLVWDDMFYPFLVYGVGAVLFVFLLIPMRNFITKRMNSVWISLIICFLANVIISMIMELVMGLLLNQPNHFGEYPLWDNSMLPLNILKQAWLINDLFLGAIATLYTWLFYPVSEIALKKLPSKVMNIASTIVVLGFVALCIVKFQ